MNQPGVRLLVVTHSRSGSTRQLVDAAMGGIADAQAHLGQTPEAKPLTAEAKGCFDAGPDDVLRADGLILATPANFGYMSGAMKDFLERIYHPCLDQTIGRPYALIVKGDTDTDGAVASVERIVAGLRWKAVLPPLAVTGPIQPVHRDRAAELGATMAAGLACGLF